MLWEARSGDYLIAEFSLSETVRWYKDAVIQ
jgi:hypothetical protein